MSRPSPRGRGAWPGSWRPELRPALPPGRPGRAAPVVVAADEAPKQAVGDPHERRAPRGGSGRASLDRAPPRHAAEPVPGRVDRRGGGPPDRIGALGDAQRGHLDRDRHRHVEQHARRGLRSRQPYRCRQTDRDRIRPGTDVGPHRARGLRRPGAHPGSDHDRLRGAGAGAQGTAHRDAGGRHRDRHGHRDRGEPAAARSRQEQGDRAAHRRRQQPRDGGSAHGGAGRGGPGERGRGRVRGPGALMAFDAPGVLAVAPLVGGAVWFAAAWARRVRIRRAALWSEETVRRALGAGRLGPTALAVAAFLGVVALAGPRWGQATIVAGTRALSVVMAMDISRSMLAEDASPNRLGRALREARRLVQDLDGDRVGLLAFAGSSYILSPLSIDGSALTLYLDALDPEVASQGGTGLAGALRQGGELLRASSDLADRVLVVFTDGEAHDTDARGRARRAPSRAGCAPGYPCCSPWRCSPRRRPRGAPPP